MRDAIRRHQTPDERTPSDAIRRHQMRDAIRPQMRDAIRRHQTRSEAIRGDKTPSDVIRRNQTHSEGLYLAFLWVDGEALAAVKVIIWLRAPLWELARRGAREVGLAAALGDVRIVGHLSKLGRHVKRLLPN